MTSLYIIGNGFDLHHGIKSHYKMHFSKFVYEVNHELYRTFEEYFSFEENWADFENSLKHIDVDNLVESNSHFAMSYGADDWSDSRHHDYQYEIERIVSLLSTELKETFTQWILSLNIPDMFSYQDSLLKLEKNVTYFNFNYTNTLNRLYSIDEENILHIHNKIENQNSDLVLGHGWNPSERKSLNDIQNIEDQDTRITQGNDLIDEYFSRTYKPTKEIIEKNQNFFNGLSSTKYVYILGHGLADVDLPYYQEIIKNINIDDVLWKVSYYTDEELSQFEDTLSRLSVDLSKVSFLKMGEFTPYKRV